MGDSVLVRAIFKFKGTNNDEVKYKWKKLIKIINCYERYKKVIDMKGIDMAQIKFFLKG